MDTRYNLLKLTGPVRNTAAGIAALRCALGCLGDTSDSKFGWGSSALHGTRPTAPGGVCCHRPRHTSTAYCNIEMHQGFITVLAQLAMRVTATFEVQNHTDICQSGPPFHRWIDHDEVALFYVQVVLPSASACCSMLTV